MKDNIHMELMCILKVIADGTIKPVPVSETWEECYAGDCTFKVGNWTVTIFIDCNDWDYIDNVITPDGRKYDYDSLSQEGYYLSLNSYSKEYVKNAADLLCEYFGDEYFGKIVKAFKTAKGE